MSCVLVRPLILRLLVSVCSIFLAWGVHVAHSIHQRELLRHHCRVKAEKIRWIFMEPVLIQQCKSTASLIDHCTHKHHHHHHHTIHNNFTQYIFNWSTQLLTNTQTRSSHLYVTNRPGRIPAEVCGGTGSGDYRPVALDQTLGSWAVSNGSVVSDRCIPGASRSPRSTDLTRHPG